MSKAQYIILAAIIGSYSLLFMMLLVRAGQGIWQARKPEVKPQVEKISRAVADARKRAWTRAVWRGTLAHEAR
jgi:hypothetical protein